MTESVSVTHARFAQHKTRIGGGAASRRALQKRYPVGRSRRLKDRLLPSDPGGTPTRRSDPEGTPDEAAQALK